MGNKRQKKKHSKSQNMENEQQQTKNEKSLEKETSNLLTEKISSLSDREYHVYTILLNTLKIGYLGVHTNGKFNYCITQDNVEKDEVLSFCNSFIQKEFGVTPIATKK